MDLIKDIYNAILDGDRGLVKDRVQAAIDARLDAQTVLNEGMVAAMAQVGQLFEEGEYFVPEMLVSARAMQDGLALLKPYLVDAGASLLGTVAAGTVKGDLHDIGKNLVCMMLEGAGFKVIDLGADVPPEKFVEAVKGGEVNIVAMSALLTTTMPGMRTTIEALKEAGVRERVKIMVGGAPVTDAFAQQIGADGYAADASKAVKVARSLVV